jgi:ribosomal protein S18 acetylase RimI-like enzyme
MIIRPAIVSDVPSVVPMVRRIAQMHQELDPGKYTFRSDPGEMYRNWLIAKTSDRRSVFIVAETDGAPTKLAGFLIATVEAEIPIYQIKEFGFIHDLWVEDHYRHEGIGRQLVSEAVERFAQIGVPQVRCDTSWENQAARSLFIACGFRPSTVEMLIEIPQKGDSTL